MEPDYLAEALKAGAFEARTTPRSTAAETAFRVNAVAEWLAQGFSRARMLRDAATRWGVSSRSVDSYMGRAFSLLARELADERAGQIAILKRRNDYHYRRAVALDNLREIGASIDARAKFLGLNAPVKQIMQLSGPDGEPMAVMEMPAKDFPIDD